MDARNNKITVLMFPWLAHGHISPYLELSKKLAKRNFYVFLCSTPINLAPIKPSLTEKYCVSIELVELHLPTLPNLPPHYHTTNGLPPHLMPTVKEAFDMSSPNFSKILENLKPDLVIYDFIQPWAPVVARQHGIPAVEYITTGAATTSYLHHRVQNPGVEFPFSALYQRDYEARRAAKLVKSDGNRPKDRQRFLDCMKECSSNVVFIKSFREIEGKYIDYLSLLVKKKIVPVGPLVQEPNSDDDDDDSEIIKWLNKKEKLSTVFVSFGSEYFLSKDDIKEIAHGLELSGVNFIWVVRFPVGENTRVEDEMPKGFLDRVKGRGLVVERWAPQGKILAHENIGGFVSHCGWSSLMEGMKHGVPIIALPMHLDQPMNARLIEEIGIGVEAVREDDGEGEGCLDRGKVAGTIKHVVVEETGECARKKAKELSEMLRLKGEEEIDAVVEELVQLCT